MPEIFQIIHSQNFAEFSPFLIFFVLFFATFITEDATCLAAGTLVGQGKISFSLAVAGCLAGIFVSDILLYWVGRIFGHSLLKTRFFSRIVSERLINKASDWLNKHGVMAIFISRVVSGLRLPTYLAAGFLKTDFRKFALFFFIAAALWTPFLIGFAAFSAEIFSTNIILAFLATLILFRLVFHLSSWKNRRLFVGRIRRITTWEFWSLKIFYFPVVIYVLFLSLRFKDLTIFTAANPAIPAGGFVGESKDEIYQGLQKSPAAKPFLLNYLLLNSEQNAENNFQSATDFIRQNSLTFPLAFKPNAGERGKEVQILKDISELRAKIENLSTPAILQEFAAGIEASVFYFRYPTQPLGEIFSITEKRFPILTGDGISNLETLILQDKRAVCLAKKYFEQNEESLERIPEIGEKVQIINIGTHSRGAIFADGEWMKTPQLEQTIDEICRGYSGFYFGRFDLKAHSFDDFKAGQNFKIIELNGVTSESTNIYDKKFSLFDAYRILFQQWKIAFEIGAENRRLGVQPTKAFDLIKLVFAKN